MKWTLLATMTIFGTLAYAAPKVAAVDMSNPLTTQDPLIYIMPAGTMPQACIDTAVTDDQKKQIMDAAYNAKREKLQLETNMKLAMMNYVHAANTATTDATAGQAAGDQVTDSVGKYIGNMVNLKTKILYTILTADQRPNGLKCLMALEKERMKHRLDKMCDNRDKDDDDNNDHGSDVRH